NDEERDSDQQIQKQTEPEPSRLANHCLRAPPPPRHHAARTSAPSWPASMSRFPAGGTAIIASSGETIMPRDGESGNQSATYNSTSTGIRTSQFDGLPAQISKAPVSAMVSSSPRYIPGNGR